MTPNKDEEPVAYLGGQAAPPASKPKAAPADEPVDGYLGGEAVQEELPALPPAQSYSASDFVAAPEQEQQPGADFGAPVEAPPAEDAAMDQQYGATEQQSEFDQYGAGTQQGYDGPSTVTESPPTVQEQPNLETSAEFAEPELPKTITQQDAENIIKRITTKKILPPEVADKEGPQVVPSQELTPRTQPGLKTFPIILVLIFALYGTALYFRDSVVKMVPPPWNAWVAAALFTSVQEEIKPVEVKKEKSPTELATEELMKKLHFSEETALGLNGAPSTPSPSPQDSPAPTPDASPTP